MSLWEQQTWRGIGSKLDNCPVALLPVGATEQHGPHLGCGVDAVLADRLCRAAAAKAGVLMLPALPYGCSLGHSRRWPGTVALQPKTLIDLVKEIGDWAFYSGVRKLFLINTHVTNAAPLRCALEMLRAEHDDLMVVLLNTAELSERVREFHFADGGDWHANDAETSLMMSVAPELVEESQLSRADDPDRTGDCVFAHPVNRTSLNGVTGKPSDASRDKGGEWFGRMVEDLVDLINKGIGEQPPLPHSWFEKVDG